jgi:hypothetical protein
MRQSPLRAFAQAAPLAVIPSILLTTPDQTPHRRRWQTRSESDQSLFL